MKTVDHATADQFFVLCRSLEPTVRTFTRDVPPDRRDRAALQAAVDQAAAGATAAALIPAAPAIGGFVTRMVVRQATSAVSEATQLTVAVCAALAACHVADESDPVRVLGVVVRSVVGKDLPAGYRPPAPEKGSVVAGGAKAARRLSGLRPDHSAVWQRALGLVPVVGLVGAGLGGQRTVTVVLRRACDELGLPRPSAASPVRLVQEGAHAAGAAVKRHLPSKG